MSTPATRALQMARLRIGAATDSAAVNHCAVSFNGYASALRDFDLVTRSEFDELSAAIAEAANLRLQQLLSRSACGRRLVLV